MMALRVFAIAVAVAGVGAGGAQAEVFLKDSAALKAAGVKIYVAEPTQGALAMPVGAVKGEKNPLFALEPTGGMRKLKRDAAKVSVPWACGAKPKKAEGFVTEDGSATAAMLIVAGENVDTKLSWKPFKMNGVNPKCVAYTPGFDRTSVRSYVVDEAGPLWYVGDFARDPTVPAKEKCPATMATVFGITGAADGETCRDLTVSAFDCDHQKIDKKGLPRVDMPLGVLAVTAPAKKAGEKPVSETWIIMRASMHESSGLIGMQIDDVSKPQVKKTVTSMYSGC